ncbi:MAG: phage tail assembly chaperone [Bacillota bacterium]
MNLTEMLLASDINEFRMPEKELEIKRLSNFYKQPFIITFRAIKPDEEEEIQRDCMTITKDGVNLDSSRMKYLTVAKCLLNPDVRNKELQKKFNAENYMELIKKLFLIGEVSAVYDQIQELSGYGKDKVEEVKNS